MKSFISYSHQDSAMLERLHTHLAHLKREGILSSWTDQEIPAGGNLNETISQELTTSQLFIALLSPDYLASNYCYEKEFKRAMQMHEAGEIIIIPIVLEPCDWLSTPFKDFKALPKDGKAVSEWQNINTAFLDITQNIRKLLEVNNSQETHASPAQSTPTSLSRNYRVKKDFDSIQRLEFVETSFVEIKDSLQRYLNELVRVDDNIKFRVLKASEQELYCILVNRNKIGAESTLVVSIESDSSPFNGYRSNDKMISYSINQANGNQDKGFALLVDDYHMFWSKSPNYFSREPMELHVKDMADIIWNEWLESVGIM